MADYKYTANTQFSTAQFSRKVDTEVSSQTSSLQKQIKEIDTVLQEKKKKSDEINKQINEFEMNLMQNTASKLAEQWKKNIASLRDQFNTLAEEQDNLTKQREQAEQQIIDVQLEGEKKKQEFFKTLGIDVYFLWEFWGIDECKNIIKHILTKDSQIEKFPYLEYGTKYLYANKDLYPNNPPYIQGYKYIEKVQKKKTVRINDSHIFEIYNSGYYKYIKQ